ncbi:MAG: Eco57I restriction-modification methylase domain-containing protein [Butyrivibrio sp.]
MKFDYCIGNPPYQDNTLGDNVTFAPPVYDKFMDAAYEIADKVELIHPARFLFNAGSTPKDWNEKMLEDDHLRILHYVEKSGDVFQGTKIRGGVCISYHDNTTKFDPIHVFTVYAVLNDIVKKVLTFKQFVTLSSIMYIQNRFNLETLYADYPNYTSLIGSGGKDKRFETGIFEKIPLFTQNKVNSDDIKVYGVVNKKRIFRYFPKKYTELSHENLDKYKVVIMKSNGEGIFGESLAAIDILGPNEAFTRSFLSFGLFDKYYKAENCRKYIMTKFARSLLGAKKVTQDNPIDTWTCVPLQDFTDKSDIDWTKSIHEIDGQLYRKYNLSDEEINFIETHVKEMK